MNNLWDALFWSVILGGCVGVTYIIIATVCREIALRRRNRGKD